MSLEVHIEKKLNGFTLRSDFTAGNTATAILGASGCGKSMTLKSIAGIIRPDQGRIALRYAQGEAAGGRVLYDSALKINEKPQVRRVGYLFQNYALFPGMTVEQNILFPVLLDYQKPDRAYLEELLTVLNLKDRRKHLPSQLSGGQQQRVAIGRALMTRPSLILADEPTGNLDTQNTSEVIALLKETSRKYEQTILMITHNRSIAQTADRVLQVSDGSLTDFGRCRE